MIRKQIDVKTLTKDPVTFEYNLSEKLTEAVEMYGEDNVHEMFLRALVIAAQANARKLMSINMLPDKIQETMDTWKPGIKIRTGVSTKNIDPVKMIEDNFDEWSPERQEAMLRLIQERFNNRMVMPAAATETVETNGEEPTAEDIAAIVEGMNGGEETPSDGENADEASSEYNVRRRRH
jgi:hypothetical protein